MYNYRVYNNLFWIFLKQMEYLLFHTPWCAGIVDNFIIYWNTLFKVFFNLYKYFIYRLDPNFVWQLPWPQERFGTPMTPGKVCKVKNEKFGHLSLFLLMTSEHAEILITLKIIHDLWVYITNSVINLCSPEHKHFKLALIFEWSYWQC